MRALLATLTAFTLFAATPVVAGDFEDGMAAYEAGDHKKAFRLWKPFAERGVAEVQYNLGQIYNEGKGVLVDKAKALHWYSKAGEQGHAKAQQVLGVMYRFGFGVPKDDAKAAYWYRKAAEPSISTSQYKYL